MKAVNPAIVTQLSARRLPRWVLVLLCTAYVLPGTLGRDPWRQADLAAFGVMWDMVHVSGDWWHPQVLGQAAEIQAWLPYWLGALAIQGLPFLPPDLASRLPFGGLLLLGLGCTWFAMYHLARLPAALPVSFAFGGEADPTDYARALADTALLALLASLGLAQFSHESTPEAAQFAFAALLLYGSARLASAHAERRWLSALVWWLGAVGLSLSGAPWIGLALGLGWLLWSLPTGSTRSGSSSVERWSVWLICATGTLLAAVLSWQLDVPNRAQQWHELQQWLEWGEWQRFGRLLLWFTWPAGLLAVWTLWRWRQRLHSAHVLLPLWFVLAALASSWLMGGYDRALLLGLPAMACLAAFAIPTLSRSVSALIDWFALLFFTGGLVVIWVIWSAMVTGHPAKPAANVARLAPGFEATFAWPLFLPAVMATVAWIALLAWRIGRHKPALWKTLTLSATGSTVCWLLLMTLWLPLLNHGMGQAPISRRIASITPPNSCVLVHGLGASHIAGLQYHGGLTLVRSQATDSKRCERLVVHPSAVNSLPQTLDMSEWQMLRSIPRLRENRDHLLVYARLD